MNGGQVDTVPVELFLVFSVGQETWAGAGCPNESCVGRKRRDHRRVNVIRVAVQVEHDIHPCPFGLCAGLGLTWEALNGLLDVDLGTCVCSNKVSQALGECGVTLVDATFALTNDAVELMGVDGAGAHLPWQRWCLGRG